MRRERHPSKRSEIRMNALRHVCFDKDGTLIDVHCYWAYNSSLRARQLVEALGLEPADTDTLTRAMGIDLAQDRIRPGGPIGYEPRPVVIEAVRSALSRLGRDVRTDEIGDLFERAGVLDVR